MKFVLPIAAVFASLAVLTWIAGRHLGGKASFAPETRAQNGAQEGPGRAPTASGHSASANQVILVVAERVRGAQRTQILTQHRESAVTLQVLLPEGAANAPYSLQVTRMDGAESAILHARGVKPTITGDRLYLITHIPEGVLTPGSYEVRVVDAEDSFISLLAVQ